MSPNPTIVASMDEGCVLLQSRDALTFASTVFFVVMAIYTLKAGRRAEPNYWGAGATTLEWTQTSPPPFHTYNELPQIK